MADLHVEEPSCTAVIHNPNEREIGALKADVGNFSDITGPVEQHALLAIRVNLTTL
jgi:hypothetical protein